MEEEIRVMPISKNSEPTKVAGAIAGFLSEEGKVELRAIGVGAVNQAVKSIAVARGYVATSGYDLICVPGFCVVTIDEEEKSGIKFIVKKV